MANVIELTPELCVPGAGGDQQSAVFPVRAQGEE